MNYNRREPTMEPVKVSAVDAQLLKMDKDVLVRKMHQAAEMSALAHRNGDIRLAKEQGERELLFKAAIEKCDA